MKLGIKYIGDRVTLWVNHKWPTSGVGHNDAIVDTEAVAWQPSDLPRTHFDRITEHCAQ